MHCSRGRWRALEIHHSQTSAGTNGGAGGAVGTGTFTSIGNAGNYMDSGAFLLSLGFFLAQAQLHFSGQQRKDLQLNQAQLDKMDLPGSGGSGAGNYAGQSGAAGGTGGAGYVIITEYIS